MKRNLLYGALLFGTAFSVAVAAKVPAEARKHLNYGAAALEIAKDNDGFQKAADEFEAAAKLAPKWPAPYYNLGLIYSKMDRYDDALRNYKKYLELAPKAKDAESVRGEIDKLEYKKEQLSDKSRFNGMWCGIFNNSADACDFNVNFWQDKNNKALCAVSAWCANSEDCGQDSGWMIDAPYLALGPDGRFEGMGAIHGNPNPDSPVIGTGRITGSLGDKDSNGKGQDLITLGFQFKGQWFTLACTKVTGNSAPRIR